MPSRIEKSSSYMAISSATIKLDTKFFFSLSKRLFVNIKTHIWRKLNLSHLLIHQNGDFSVDFLLKLFKTQNAECLNIQNLVVVVGFL
jgi:hypothetical protein